MGNSESECGFSNATNFDVKFELHSDKKIITKSDTDVGGGLNVGTDPDIKGFTTVKSNNRLDLKDHSGAKNSTAYITIIIMYDDGSMDVHTSNFEVNGGSCNYMLGTNIHGRDEFVKLHEKRTWRAKGGYGTQNYYGNRVCNGCGKQVKCKRNCSDLAEFGGHKE